MFYHASPVKGLAQLEPRISNQDIPLVYFSRKRENVLVYLSNAVEKYCRETGFCHEGRWNKWGPYGFDKDGRMRLEEYYPDALRLTYEGVSGWIYMSEAVEDCGVSLQIPDAVSSRIPVKVSGAEYVPDAYEAILKAEAEGSVRILRYDQIPEKMRERIEKIIREEYEGADSHTEYRHFLKGRFFHIIAD